MLQPDMSLATFNYTHVDGFGRAKQRNAEPRLNGLLKADSIGPLIEFGNISALGGPKALSAASWLDVGARDSFIKAWTGTDSAWSSYTGECGFIRRNAILSEGALNSFKIDMHRSALKVSFKKTTSLLVAAIVELMGNIEDHSESADTGFAAFLACDKTFELVVADRGIGVLSSLRKNSEHALITDEGKALSQMVMSGVSRFGSGSGHGHGFRPIFEKLADMTGQLRFRSGDHALSLNGMFGNTISLQISQKPRISGFLAAVRCQLADN